MSDVKTVKCSRCKVAIQGPAEPKPKDRMACPSCGEGDSFENVMRIVGDYVEQEMGDYLFGGLERATRGSKAISVSRDPRPKQAHRFYVDLQLQAP